MATEIGISLTNSDLPQFVEVLLSILLSDLRWLYKFMALISPRYTF